MSKYDASKETGMPPHETTAFQTPDRRLSGPRMPQSDRRAIFTGKPKQSPFSKLGVVGPMR